MRVIILVMSKKIKIESFQETKEVESVSELVAFLSKRDQRNSNSFWLSKKDQSYPTINILVNGEFAYAHFWALEESAGFRSIGNCDELEKNDGTIFYLSENEEEQLIWNNMVLTFEKSLEVAKEFFLNQKLPKSIKWEEL